MFTLYIEDIAGGQTHEHAFDEGELVVGRSRERCDIVLPADNVSRRHSRIYIADGRCYVQDMGSSNGVFFDGVRIRDVREVETTNRIRIGDYVLYVSSDETASAPPGDFGRLVGVTAAHSQTYPIREAVSLVGRGKDTAVTIIDHSVSRIHSKLTVTQNGDFVLQDLRSSNGTFVNERRIEQQVLRHGDRVRFGSTEFVFEMAGQADVAEPTAGPADMVPVSASSGAPAGASPAGWGGAQAAPAPAVDPYAEYGGYEEEEPPRSKKWLLIVIILLVLAAVAVVLVLVLSGGGKADGGKTSDDTTEEPVDDGGGADEDEAKERERRRAERVAEEIEEDLAAAKQAIGARNWSGALEAYTRVLDNDAENTEAAEGMGFVTRESTVAMQFAAAEAHRESRAFGKALVAFAAIPEGSTYREDAVKAGQAIRDMFQQLVDEGDLAKDAHQWQTAHDRYREALMIQPDMPMIEKRLKRVERKLRR